ncbi:MAG: ABC transporter ATP-binding protein/permease [Eubacteriales bacterium]|nr:ABC transporter ATP-binding protein/permease [Eubacteriales bacterium]
MIKKLSAYIGQYKMQALLSPILVLFEVVLEVFIPLLMGKIVDVGIPTRDFGYILRMGGLMVVMAAGALVFGAFCARVAVVASNGMSTNLRKGLFDKIESFSFKNTDHFTTPSLITRLTNDVNNIQNSFQMIIRMLARAPFMLILASVMAYRISPRLSVIIFAAIPALALVMGLLAKLAFPRFEAMLQKYDSMNARTQENLVAIRVVKAFVRGDYESVKFKDSAAALKNAQRKAEKILVLAMPIMQLTMYTSILLVLLVGGKDILAGNLMTGQLMSFISYITQILVSLMMILMVFVTLVLSSASAKRIVEVLDEVPAINDDAAISGLTVENGSIEFCNASFSYASDANNLALSNINLSIRSGETIGIIGGSGSAKSTLVQLIPRLYEVFSGEVLVGGHNVKDYKIEALRASIGMVLQKNVLFSGTIKDNLRWGNPNATDEEITAACKAAQADSFIRSFPDGYDTVLGQGGVNVSGGQKQRLCIARALVKNPRILILDDSTSAVDTATDAAIRAAFTEHHGDATTIIIAQRITSVMEADRIVVLQDGAIDGVGTHEELMNTNEIYRDVYLSQQKGVA